MSKTISLKIGNPGDGNFVDIGFEMKTDNHQELKEYLRLRRDLIMIVDRYRTGEKWMRGWDSIKEKIAGQQVQESKEFFYPFPFDMDLMGLL